MNDTRIRYISLDGSVSHTLDKKVYVFTDDGIPKVPHIQVEIRLLKVEKNFDHAREKRPLTLKDRIRNLLPRRKG